MAKIMEKSAVTDYVIQYIQDNKISTDYISEIMGISAAKLQADYTEPLSAEEFLELCVFLHLSPEKVQFETILGKK